MDSVTVLDGPSVQTQFEVDFSAFPYQPAGERVRVGANSHGADWTMRDLKAYYLD